MNSAHRNQYSASGIARSRNQVCFFRVGDGGILQKGTFLLKSDFFVSKNALDTPILDLLGDLGGDFGPSWGLGRGN